MWFAKENVFTRGLVGTSLVIQGLRLYASNGGGPGLLLDQGPKIPHVMQVWSKHKYIYTFIYLFVFIFYLCWALAALCRLSLVSESRGYCLLGVLGLLTVMAFLVAGRRL